MTRFQCNLCGNWCEVEHFASEPSTCSCGSNVRIRALVDLLSRELFGCRLALKDFPRMKSIRGLGMTDKPCYAELLAEKFDYTNTHYDREPRMDFTGEHPELAGTVDFILSADVLEHIAPPSSRPLREVHRLLRPHGFMVVTVYCNPTDELKEHYPELHEYRVLQLGGEPVLVNRRRDGAIEVHSDLVFHGGTGSTLEMREFGETALTKAILDAGFEDVYFQRKDVPELGILFDHDVSQPLVARKAPFVLHAAARRELTCALLEARNEAKEQWIRGERYLEQMRLAGNSKWLKLGRRLGVGPAFGT